MPMLPGNMTPNFAQQATMPPIDRCIQANPHCGLERGMGTFNHEFHNPLDTIGQPIKFGSGSSLPLRLEPHNSTYYAIAQPFSSPILPKIIKDIHYIP